MGYHLLNSCQNYEELFNETMYIPSPTFNHATPRLGSDTFNFCGLCQATVNNGFKQLANAYLSHQRMKSKRGSLCLWYCGGIYSNPLAYTLIKRAVTAAIVTDT